MANKEVNIQDFEKIDLRVGEIISVEEMEGIENLYTVVVDIGEKRQIVVRTKPWYFLDQLEGKRVIVITNLNPTNILGVESQGMLLVAEDNRTISLLTVDRDIENGTKIM
ncbi:MAG: methionine--tRNA ligase [Candidatus Hydrothermarchaeales archaeon]